MISGENFQRLKQEQENYLRICDEKIQQWEKFKNDYKALSARLETLPNEIKHDVMVPISKYAFIPGKLIHTNEILVLLGENWFVEKSAKQAREVIDRRLAGIDKHLEDLNKEKNIIESQFKWTENIMNEKGNYVNIEEKVEDVPKKDNIKKKQLTDEEKKELRRKQQEKALKFQKKIDEDIKSGYEDLHFKSKTTKANDEESELEEDEDQENRKKEIQTFEDLNLIEESFDKMILENEHTKSNENIDDEYRKQFKEMLIDYEKNIDRKNNELMQIEIEKNVKSKQQALKQQPNLSKKSVKWSDENINKISEFEKEINNDDYDSDDYDEDEYDDEEEDYDDESNLHDVDRVDTKTNIIRIKHTKSEEIESIERNLKLSRDKQEINSPADIFSKFYRPKSILKSSSVTSISSTSNQINADEEYESNKPAVKVEPKNAEMGKFQPEKAFSGQIVERSSSLNETKQTDDTTTKKKVSKFKASKQN